MSEAWGGGCESLPIDALKDVVQCIQVYVCCNKTKKNTNLLLVYIASIDRRLCRCNLETIKVELRFHVSISIACKYIDSTKIYLAFTI